MLIPKITVYIRCFLQGFNQLYGRIRRFNMVLSETCSSQFLPRFVSLQLQCQFSLQRLQRLQIKPSVKSVTARLRMHVKHCYKCEECLLKHH